MIAQVRPTIPKKYMALKYFIIAMLPIIAIGWLFINDNKPASPISGKLAERKDLGKKIPTAILLWSRDGLIMRSSIINWNPEPVTIGENPRWSPDGTMIVFSRDDDLWLINKDLSEQRKILHNIYNDYSTGGYWTGSGDAITAINKLNPKQVLKYDLATSSVTILHDEMILPFKGLNLSQCAELRVENRYLLTFTRDSGHCAMIVDLIDKVYLANNYMKKGDCEPAWAPNGKFIVNTRRDFFRPIYKADFDAENGIIKESEYVIGKGRCHSSSVSNDSKYILYSSSGNIFCWEIGKRVTKERQGNQLTFDMKNDTGPSLYIF